MMSARLEGRGVGKQFGGLRVLSHVDFAVESGEIVALIGPNGAGKTTLFNLVSGLERPGAGSIRLDGREITRLPAYRIARLGVGRTFQTPRPFLDLTAAENVGAAILFARRAVDSEPADEAPARGGATPQALLALLDLGPCAGTIARHLPLSRRKLLELAMALALGPRIVLLDEILAGLTPAEVTAATAILRRLRDERGIGLFWVEHVMSAVMETAGRVLVLHHGEVICEGPPAAVSRDPRVIEAYLGDPAADEAIAS
ncbi:MAG TPA: ABC transporter ATP-binding protein [Candidatus Binatia bacterium]|nr:ABC transporter ATP-binding protein [Candidatus Binatia bacterium]